MKEKLRVIAALLRDVIADPSLHPTVAQGLRIALTWVDTAAGVQKQVDGE